VADGNVRLGWTENVDAAGGSNDTAGKRDDGTPDDDDAAGAPTLPLSAAGRAVAFCTGAAVAATGASAGAAAAAVAGAHKFAGGWAETACFCTGLSLRSGDWNSRWRLVMLMAGDTAVLTPLMLLLLLLLELKLLLLLFMLVLAASRLLLFRKLVVPATFISASFFITPGGTVLSCHGGDC
jgi:hypothetical protein